MCEIQTFRHTHTGTHSPVISNTATQQKCIDYFCVPKFKLAMLYSTSDVGYLLAYQLVQKRTWPVNTIYWVFNSIWSAHCQKESLHLMYICKHQNSMERLGCREYIEK